MMDSLKSSLENKLLELELESAVGRNDWEALAQGSTSFISVMQCETVDNWQNDCVKNEYERRLGAFEKVPLVQNERRPSLIDSIIEDDDHCNRSYEAFDEADDADNDYNRLVLKAQRAIRGQAIKALVEKRDLLCLQKDEMQVLIWLFCKNSENFCSQDPTMRVEDCIISFQGYQTAVSEFSEYIKNKRGVPSNGVKWLGSDSLWMMKWFTTKLFLKLSRHELGGKVRTPKLIEYVQKRVWNYRFRLDLLEYDPEGKGYIKKDQLGLYLSRHWKNFSRDENQDLEEIRPFIDYMLSEIFFLLDPYKRGRVRIDELLGCRLIPFVRKECQDGSVFKAFNLKRLAFYRHSEDNVQLSVSKFCEKFPEIARYIWKDSDKIRNKNVRFLESSVKRLAGDEEDGLGFETFLDITFAWENLSHSFSSIWYFFRALDTEYKGYLEMEDLQYHYQKLQEYWEQKHDKNSDMSKNMMKVQTRINDLLVREGVSRITPEVLHKIPGGFLVIDYLINPEASSSESPSIAQTMQKKLI